jgi:hypothetical protein
MIITLLTLVIITLFCLNNLATSHYTNLPAIRGGYPAVWGGRPRGVLAAFFPFLNFGRWSCLPGVAGQVSACGLRGETRGRLPFLRFLDFGRQRSFLDFGRIRAKGGGSGCRDLGLPSENLGSLTLGDD